MPATPDKTNQANLAQSSAPPDQKIPEKVATSWGDLQELLYSGSYDQGLKRFRSPMAFRGRPVREAGLETALQRLSDVSHDLEGHMLRNFRKYAGMQAVPTDSPWNWMALAQHHGLPTRLLDWTYSPFVAMHFATADLRVTSQDAVVWCVNFVRVEEFLPKKLRKILEEEGSDVFTAEMIQRAAPTIAELDALEGEPFPLFFEPPSFDDRIVSQSALFSLMSSPTARIDEWLISKDDLLHKVVIPAALKWEVRDKLDQANITERSLFPGLDGLTQWLKRYYGPKR